MEQLRNVYTLLIVIFSLIQLYDTIDEKVDNEIILKRVRRIIKGHIAKPGQVKSIDSNVLPLKFCLIFNFSYV